ncbi:MAG: putative pre6S rRNA nuclease [Gaiellales bacterium]|jgi:putative Holliday junction resolvase|nr:putative pre6S rRNA nuclease [Gaiellales bacterium]
MKVLALDYGRARTGLAVSDATGTLARPLGVVERVGSDAGMRRLLDRIDQEQPERLVVGLPLTLRGEQGEQARETLAFVERLRSRCPLPVETYDERFTTTLAGRSAGSRHGDDALAAAHLLEGYLTRLAG